MGVWHETCRAKINEYLHQVGNWLLFQTKCKVQPPETIRKCFVIDWLVIFICYNTSGCKNIKFILSACWSEIWHRPQSILSFVCYEGGPKNNWKLNVARKLEVVARCAARCRESIQYSSSPPRGVNLGWLLLLLWLFFCKCLLGSSVIFMMADNKEQRVCVKFFFFCQGNQLLKSF